MVPGKWIEGSNSIPLHAEIIGDVSVEAADVSSTHLDASDGLSVDVQNRSLHGRPGAVVVSERAAAELAEALGG